MLGETQSEGEQEHLERADGWLPGLVNCTEELPTALILPLEEKSTRKLRNARLQNTFLEHTTVTVCA